MKRIVPNVLVRVLGAVAWSLAACEGEPPVNSPENPTPAAPLNRPGVAPSSITAEKATEDAGPVQSCLSASCVPVSLPIGAGVASAAADGGAGSDAATAPALLGSDVKQRGNITGTVTTKPAAMAANAVVYLEDGPKEDAPGHLQTVTIDNRQMAFIPFVSVVAVGGKVVFANADPFPHNVFSPDNEKFNMGNIPQNGARSHVFEHSGSYVLLCNLHPGMLGYLLVTPSTHFARTDSKGHFAMKHIPLGTYQMTAWAPRQAPVTQPVTVTEVDGSANFDLHR